MTTVHHWNTGRHYAPEGGQHIYAAFAGQHCVVFFDHSRNIPGLIKVSLPHYDDYISSDQLMVQVMKHYDRGQYRQVDGAYASTILCLLEKWANADQRKEEPEDEYVDSVEEYLSQWK